MSDRLQKVLDDELAPDRLPPGELAELEAYEESIQGALAGLRSEAVPDVAPAVMRRLEQLPDLGGEATGGEPAWRRALAALWQPRPVTLTLRPAFGVAAAGLALALLVPWVAGGGPAGGPGVVETPVAGVGETPVAGGAVAEGPAEQVMVQFRLQVGDASQVQLAADFTGWEPRYELHELQPGVWAVVVPVTPGVHEYAFVVDGQRWVADPLAPVVDDGFGGTNSRLDVLPPAEVAL